MLLFQNAFFMPWLAAIAVPLVIHLLTRRTRRRIDLPTVKFLKKSMASQSQIWRWRHLVALILRTLAIAALVTAFMKPKLLPAYAGAQGEKAAVIIVLDVSASMAYTSGGISTFSKAKSQALDTLHGLGAGDGANVIFCAAQPSLASEKPTEDHGLLETELERAEVTDQRADGAAAVELAVDQLAKMNTSVKRLVIVSDFQRTNWADVRFESVPPNTKLGFVSVDSGARENIGLTALRSKPAMPRIGEPTSIQAEVFNSSDAVKRVPVQLKLSDGRKFSDVVTAGAFSSGNVSFPVTFEKAERVELTADIPDDNLLADNQRRATVDLRGTANIVLLTDEDVDSPTTASYYLSRALNPDPGSTTGFRVLQVRPSQLNNPTLKAADAVIVCNAPSMPEVQYEALSRYVTGGGNLMWILYGDRLQEQLAAFGQRLPKGEPLPFTVQSLANVSGQGQGYVRLAEAKYDSKLLKVFRDPSSGLNFAKFYRFFITSEVEPRGEVLLKYEDGSVAVVKTGEGSGNLLLLNFSPAPSWSDLARQDVFVPLVHELLKGILLRDSGAREFNPGDTASATIAQTNQEVTCQDPDGRMVPTTLDRTTGSVVLDRVAKSGFFHVYSGAEMAASIPVNPHPDESDLRSIDPRELESKRLQQVSVLQAASGGQDLGNTQKGRDIWPYLFALALLSLLAEQTVRLAAHQPKKAERAK